MRKSLSSNMQNKFRTLESFAAFREFDRPANCQRQPRTDFCDLERTGSPRSGRSHPRKSSRISSWKMSTRLVRLKLRGPLQPTKTYVPTTTTTVSLQYLFVDPLVLNSFADYLRDPALEPNSFRRHLKTFLYCTLHCESEKNKVLYSCR